MRHLSAPEWTEIVHAYQNEIRPDGTPVSCQELAERFGRNVKSIIMGLRNRGVTMRTNRGGRRRKRERVDSESLALTNEIRREAQVLALCSTLSQLSKKRVYLREIERAFSCSAFDAGTIAKAVADRIGGSLGFEPHAGHNGNRLFVEKTSARAPDDELGSLVPFSRIRKAHFVGVIDKCHGNRKEAARVLKIDERTLYRHLAAWGMVKPGERIDAVTLVQNAKNGGAS